MNPEQKYHFYKEYCTKHPKNTLDFICDKENCDYYLNLECSECR